ncbi:MFS transporter [Pseudomonas abieticivorans]|uniref:MFS transporter n=1 Tax=Pseudomonas abieticivorans TaxID=2931382 RepID=UPI0020BFFA14|nr:MFS transporter [Pseudomonas sp. PIA16]
MQISRWAAVMVLACSAFAMVTSEFAPIGLLSQISADLGSDAASVGWSVTLYAWLGALCGLLSPRLHAHVPRRALLTGLMLTLAGSNAAVAVAPNFAGFGLARAVGAVAHGLFWASVAASAAQLVPARRVGLATSLVFGGITVATVLGVPLINLLGQGYGWRSGFAGLAGLCVLMALGVGVLMPRAAVTAQATPARMVEVLLRRDLLPVYAITALTAAAHFCAFTFIEPYISLVRGISAFEVAALLFGFGLAGLAGNLLTAWLIDRHLQATLLVAMITMCLALLALGGGGPAMGLVPVSMLLVLWGVAIAMLFAGLQAYVLQVAGSATLVAAALHTAVLNMAIGVGAIIGGLALGTWHLGSAMLPAALIALPAVYLLRRLAVRNPLPVGADLSANSAPRSAR